VTFGSTGPFTVDGKPQSLGDHPRHESRWGKVERLATTFELAGEKAKLSHDFDAGRRTAGTA